MTKPIFIIRFPSNSSLDEVTASRSGIEESKDVMKDYHILVIKDKYEEGEIKFECYNSPHTEIEFEELKKQILKLIK
jgi:hypothetical protein